MGVRNLFNYTCVAMSYIHYLYETTVSQSTVIAKLKKSLCGNYFRIRNTRVCQGRNDNKKRQRCQTLNSILHCRKVYSE